MRFFIILAIFVAISAKIAIFSENAYYLRILYMRALAQDISTKIYPIDLKFGGVIYLHITTKIAHFIRNWSIFSLYFFTEINWLPVAELKKNTQKNKKNEKTCD